MIRDSMKLHEWTKEIARKEKSETLNVQND